MSFMPFGFCCKSLVTEEEEPAAALFPPEDYADTDYTWWAYTTTESSKVVKIFFSDPDIFIDWGDGNSETLDLAGGQTLQHTYTTAGSYLVKMSGSSTQLKFNTSGSTVEMAEWYTPFQGYTFTDAQYMFANCSSLLSVPDGLFAGLPGLTNYTKVFNRCHGLTTANDILPTPSTTSPNFQGLYQQATGLRSIDPNFFANINPTDHPGANFQHCFRLLDMGGNDVPDMWTAYGSTYALGRYYVFQSTNIGNIGSIPSNWIS